MDNTSGSTALIGAKPGRDAEVVRRLREAGVIILGIANLTQWGNNRDPHTAGNGWSATGGQSIGIFIENQDPGGSSTGPVLGTALGLASAALGTEVEGSIVCVAAKSNVVGLKPTVGLVSRDLVMVSRRLGSVGPITRCVKDAAALLSIIAGKCPHDPETARIPFDIVPDYVSSCTIGGLRDARIGVPRNALKGHLPYAELTPYEAEKFEKHLDIIRDLGAAVVDSNFESYDEALKSQSCSIVKGTDFKLDLADYLKSLEVNPNKINNLQDIINWTQNDPREEYHLRGTRAMEGTWVDGLDNRDNEQFKQALQFMEYLAHEGGVRGALQKDGLDALVLPTCVSPIIPALGGYPMITVPLGFYPKDTEIKMNQRGDLVERGPNVP